MKAITHYEVYRADGDQWAMVGRYTAGERELALAEARRFEDRTVPVTVVEENEELSSGQFDVRVVHRSVNATSNIRVPASGSDLGSRLFMIALNALTVGAIGMILTAVGAGRAGLPESMRNVALLGSFAGATVLSGLLLFRVYIPVGVILWRAKDPDSRRRTVQALAQGRVMPFMDTPPEPESELDPTVGAEMPAAAPAEPTLAMGFDAASVPDLAMEPPVIEAPPAEAAPPPVETAPAAPVAVDAMDAPPMPVATDAGQFADDARAGLVEKLKPTLAKFAEQALSVLAHTRPNLTQPDRLGLNLYFLGAARSVADRNGLDDTAGRSLLESMLTGARVPPHDIAAFFAEFDIAGERPRYRRMMDDGKFAIGATAFGESQTENLPTITELLIRWSDPAMRGSEPQQVTFLLTDMVGSTAMTSELGNAGAQRVVRAHNAIARAAAKAFRGREVKHTGDGMLLIFPDTTTGARAAIDIQQEASIYAADNATAPLALRVGLHTGEAVFEDGEYYGPAVTIVSGLCALVNTGEICCSATVRQKSPSSLRFEALGISTVKGASTAIETLKLLWDPKRSLKKSVLEYRQLGAAPAGAAPAETDPNGSQAG